MITEHDIAAHRLAEAIDKARYWYDKLDERRKALLPALGPDIEAFGIVVASGLRASAPFTLVTEEQKDGIFAMYAEELADYSYRERGDLATSDFTEFDWRIEQDMIDEAEAEEARLAVEAAPQKV